MDEDQISQQPFLTFFSEETAEYDVIVDQSSSAPNLKEATWSAVQPLLPILGERMGPDEIALLLEYSPMPESFLEKLKAIQAQKAQQPPPPDPEILKIEAQQKAKAAELQMRQQEAAVELQLEEKKTAAQLQLEQQKVAAQIQLEREKAMASLQLEREKSVLNMDIERQRMGFERERADSEMQYKRQSEEADKVAKLDMARFDAALNFKDSPEKLTEMLHDKKLTSAIEQMTQAMTALAQAQTQMAQSQIESNRAIAQSVENLREAMSRPKRLVRGPDGRAMGVE